MNIVSVIPARGGSKGLKNKNIKEFAGQPLLSYSILDSLRMTDVEQTFVSTDSEDIMKIAKKYGAEVPFQRPSKYSKDNSPDYQWVNHFLILFKLIYEYLPEYIVHLRATTPIRDIQILDNAIEALKSNPQASGLRSVELFSETPYKWVKLDSNGYFEPLLGDDKDSHVKRRQDYPNVYRPNGYIDIYRVSTILKGNLCGDRVLGYITPLSVEIDDKETFELAEAMMIKKFGHMYDDI